MAKKTAVEQKLDDLCEKVDEKTEETKQSIDKLGDRMERALAEHVKEDDAMFEKHEQKFERQAEKISNLEKTLVRYGVLVAIGSVAFGAVANAAVRGYFGG